VYFAVNTLQTNCCTLIKEDTAVLSHCL